MCFYGTVIYLYYYIYFYIYCRLLLYIIQNYFSHYLHINKLYLFCHYLFHMHYALEDYIYFISIVFFKYKVNVNLYWNLLKQIIFLNKPIIYIFIYISIEISRFEPGPQILEQIISLKKNNYAILHTYFSGNIFYSYIYHSPITELRHFTKLTLYYNNHSLL